MNKAIALAIVLLPSAVAADEVFLKGAGKVSGQIVERTDSAVTVDIGAGTVTIPMARVDRIEEGPSALGEYRQRAAALDPSNADGWRELGRWASDRGLNTQAREAYERVVAVTPDDAEANRALGRVEVDGRWVSEEEAYRARGYVQFEGEWMTPAQQQAILQERAASESAERERRESDERVREAEARAQEAEARARQAEAEAQQAKDGIPLYWGWGVGPAAWPQARPPVAVPLPAQRPR